MGRKLQPMRPRQRYASLYSKGQYLPTSKAQASMMSVIFFGRIEILLKRAARARIRPPGSPPRYGVRGKMGTSIVIQELARPGHVKQYPSSCILSWCNHSSPNTIYLLICLVRKKNSLQELVETAVTRGMV